MTFTEIVKGDPIHRFSGPLLHDVDEHDDKNETFEANVTLGKDSFVYR